MDFPTVIIDELIEHFSKPELLLLRSINRHWNSIIVPFGFDCFEPFSPYSGELKTSSAEYLERFGHVVSEICFDNFCPVFGKQIITSCPSFSSLVIRNDYYGDYEHFPDEFYSFIKEITTLKKIAIRRELSFSVLESILSPITQLKTIEIYGDALSGNKLVELFSNFDCTHLEQISVVFGQLSPELTQLLSERCPKLKEYNFRIAHYSSGDISSFKDLIPSSKVTRADIEVPDSVYYENLVFDLSDFQSLKHLGLNVYMMELQHIESEWPQIQSLHLWGNFSSFPLMINTLFPNLTSLYLSIMDSTPSEYNVIIKNATELRDLAIFVGSEADKVFDLPHQEYALKRLSVVFSTSASPSLFKWISSCLPHLKELSITSYSCSDIEEAYFSEPLTYLPIVRFFSKCRYTPQFWVSFVKACPNLQDLILEAGYGDDIQEIQKSYATLNFPPHYSLDKIMFL